MKDPIASHQHNVDALLNALGAARDAKVRRVVYAASASVAGDNAWARSSAPINWATVFIPYRRAKRPFLIIATQATKR